MIEITEINFYGNRNGNFIGYVKAVINRSVAIYHMRLVEHQGKLILSMPCRKNKDDQWVEIFHPINQAARKALEESVFSAYRAKGVCEPAKV